MKTISGLILLLYCYTAAAQGDDCNNPYSLTLDGVCRSYTISSTADVALHCTNSTYYSGTGRTTIFSFKTNATASCVLINLTTSGNQPAEVMIYETCTGGGSLHTPLLTSSVCFDDGTGLWAPCETEVLLANTTYFLRVWTPGSGTLTMCAKNYDPPNNFCSGATPIGAIPITDNNACNKGSTEVLPEQLCAFSLENTAFYTYMVDNTGTTLLSISNIKCDNNDLGVNAAFQIGFFTGTCGSLHPENCYTDSAGTVLASTASFPAGTQITVAIDGMIGSNCSYSISAFNSIVLPMNLKYFTAWTKPGANVLRWLTVSETNNSHFEIEKSPDGAHFSKIGTIHGKNNSNTETDYSFEDGSLLSSQFYRLKLVSSNGKYIYSNIVQIKRENVKSESVIFQNRGSDKLVINANTTVDRNVGIRIIDVLGRQMKVQNTSFTKGENSYTVDIHSLNKGLYYLILTDNNSQKQYSFIKE